MNCSTPDIKSLERTIRSTLSKVCPSSASDLVTECRSELQRINDEGSHLEALQQQRRRMEQLRQKFNHLVNEKEEREREIGLLQGERGRLKQYKDRYEQTLLTNDRLQFQLQRYKQENQALSQELAKHEQENLRQVVIQAKEDMLTLQSEYCRLKNELDLKNGQLKSARNMVHELNDKLQLAQHEQKHTKMESSLLERDLSEKLEVCKKQMQQMVKAIAIRDEEIRERGVAHEKGRQENNNLQRKCAHSQETIVELKREVDNLCNEKQKQKAQNQLQLNRIEGTNRQLSSELKTLKMKIKELELDKNGLMVSKAKLQEHVDNERLEALRGSQKTNQTKEKLDQAYHEIVRLTTLVEELEKQLICYKERQSSNLQMCREFGRMREQLRCECEQEKERMNQVVDNFQSTYNRIIRKF